MSNLFEELKRRNVIRVAIAYAVVGWLIIEVIDTIAPRMAMPEWVPGFFIILVLVGFPIALLFSWAFEMTPQGLKKTHEVDADDSITHSTGRKLDFMIIGALVLGLGYFVWERQQQPTAPHPEAAEGTPTFKAIAVLPFVNLSNDPEQEFFSDGISEELLNVLAKVEGLRVTSRTSAFAFKGKDTPIPDIAAALGVQYVLEGSVRRGAGQVRITAQLIDVETDSHLWSETYDRDISNIFVVQDEIAARVAEALKVALLGADEQPIAPILQTSIEVYSDFLLARQKMAEFSFEAMLDAESLLKRVIAGDAAFAPAYATLSQLYLSMARTGILSLAEAVDRMKPLVDTALALDGRLAGAWLARTIILDHDGRPMEAEAARRRAYALEPNNPDILRDKLKRGHRTSQPGDLTPVIDQLRAVDPLSESTFIDLGSWYHRQGQYAALRAVLNRLLEVYPNSSTFSFFTVLFPLPEDGNGQKIAASRNGMSLAPLDPDAPAFLVLFLLDAGETAEVPSLIERGRELDPDHPFVAVSEAIYHVYRREMADAARIARPLAQPHTSARMGSGDLARRILLAESLAAGDGAELVPLYLGAYPGLAEANLTATNRSLGRYPKWGQLMAALDLAAIYQRTGESEKAEVLMAAVETELPFWPRRGMAGAGLADAELYALRGEDARALDALRRAAEEGWTYSWWWFLDHSPHLEPLRALPEFAKIRADFAARAALPLAEERE